MVEILFAKKTDLDNTTTTADAALARAGGQMIGNITMAASETVDGRDLSVDGTKLDGVETSADLTLAGAGLTKTGSTLDVIAGDGSITVNSNDITVGVITGVQHGTLGGGTLHTDVIAGGADGFMTGTDKTKLDGIETAATADQTGAEIKTAYQAEPNAYTDTKNTKLAGIETAATVDQTNAEIKTAYEANANTNEFDDAEQTKLAGIDTGATKGVTTISNTAITAITNLDVTGFASATYDNYEVWISNGQPGNDTVGLELETSTDGGTSFDVGASDYTWVMARVLEDGAALDTGDADDTEITLTGTTTVGNAANENINVKISVFSPEATEFTTFVWSGVLRSPTTLLIGFRGGGDRQSAADVDALRFHWSAGDWAAQGNIQFLGIAQ